MKPMH